jgi:hypothetical protein
MRFIHRSCFAGFAIAAQGAGGSSHAQVARVVLEPAQVTITAGDSVRLRLSAWTASGTPLATDSAFWAAGPFEVATVATDGWVRTYRRGTARVMARLGGKSVWSEIEIRPKPATSIDLDWDDGMVVVGGRTMVRAVVRDRDREPLTDAPVSFRSPDSLTAHVSAGGVVEGRRPGLARIEVASGGIRRRETFRVVANPVARIQIEGPPRGRTGDVLRFEAHLTGLGGREITDLRPAWSIASAGATVYPDGGFVAERAGAYLVTATVGNRSSSQAVTIAPRLHEQRVELVGSQVYSDIQAAELWAIGDALYVSTVLDRVYVYDLARPAEPRLTDSVMVDARLINDIATTADGTIGVLTREGASSRKNGVVFLDLTDPLHPRILSEYTETVTSGVHSIFIDGRLLYLTDNGHRALRIVDFSDPRSPTEVGRWQIENSVVSQGGSGAGFAREVEVNGRYLHDLQVVDGIAYLAYFKDGLIILDVGNGIRGGTPRAPKLVSQFTYATADYYPPEMIAGTHTMFRFDRYLVVGDEVLPAFSNPWSRDYVRSLGRLHILDVADLTRPQLVAFYEVPDQGSHNVWVEDRIMYVGSFEAGLRVVDLSGELRGDLRKQGREIGGIRTAAPNGFRPNVPMAWGARPHKGMIYVTDMNSGLWVGRLARRAVP